MLFGIIMSAYLQFGYLTGACYEQQIYEYHNRVSINTTYHEQQPFYGKFGASFEKPFYFEGIKIIPFIDASVNTMMVPIKITNWSPTEMIYKIGGGIKINNFFIIGIEHTCYHPMSTYEYAYDYIVTDSYEGGSNRIYGEFRISNIGGN